MTITSAILVMKLIILKTTKTMLVVIGEVIEILGNGRGVFRTLSNIYDGAFCENGYRPLAAHHSLVQKKVWPPLVKFC